MDGVDKVEVEAKTDEDVVLQVLQVLVVDALALLLAEVVDHAIVTWLHWLVEFACEDHANDAKVDEGGAINYPMANDVEVTVKDCRCNHERLKLVLFLFLEHYQALHAFCPVFSGYEFCNINFHH